MKILLVRYFGLPSHLVGTTVVFCWLAFVINNLVIIGASVGESALVSKLGAKSLPFGYIALAILSFSLSLLLTRFIDFVPKTRILFWALSGLLGFTILSHFCLKSETDLGIYLSFGGLLSVESVFIIMFSELLKERLNIVNVKKVIGILAAFTALGGITGGGLVSLLSGHMPLHQIILILMPFIGLGIYLCTKLKDNLVQKVGVESAGLIESLKFLPKMLRHNRVIPFIYMTCIALLILKTILSYGYLNIYEEHYPKPEDMSQFLGGIYLFLNALELLIGIVVVGFVLLRFSPIVKNMIYPMMAIMACIGLFFYPLIGFAVYAQFMVQSLKNTIHDSVKDQNYNALPDVYTGRTRIIEDGVLAPFVLVVAALCLVYLQNFLQLQHIMIIGVFITLLMMVSAFKIGHFYVLQLTHNLRSGQSLDATWSEDIPLILDEDLLKDILQSSNTQSLHYALLKIDKRMLVKMQSTLALIPWPDQVCINHVVDLFFQLDRFQKERFLRKFLDQSLTPFWEAIMTLIMMRDPQLLNVYNPPLSEAARAFLKNDEMEIDINSNLDVVLAIMEGSRLPRFLKNENLLLNNIKKNRLSEWIMALRIRPEDLPFVDELATSWAHHSNPYFKFAACVLWQRISKDTKNVAPIYHLLYEQDLPLRRRALETIIMIDRDLERFQHLISPQSRYLMKKFFKTQDPHIEKALYAMVEMHLHETLRLLPYKNQLIDNNDKLLLICLDDMEKTSFRYLNDLLCSMGRTKLAREIILALSDPASEKYPLAIEALENLGNQKFIKPFTDYFSLLMDLELSLSVSEDDLLSFIKLSKNQTIANIANLRIQGLNQQELEDKMKLLIGLKETELFHNLSMDELQALVQEGTVKHYPKNETILKKGDECRELYIILKGSVSVIDGKKTIATLHQNDFFGEIALFTDLSRSATIITLEDTEVFIINQEDFKDAVYNEPGVIMDICRLLSKRLIATNAKAI